MTEPPPRDLDEVQQRLKEIQSRKRPGIRWHISKHTAELAIDALGRVNVEAGEKVGPSSKRRRRKRRKRLL